MTVSKWLKPIVLVSRKEASGRRGLVLFTHIQTKEQEVSTEMLQDLRVELLDGISRWSIYG